jgi:hypothetical protein
MQGGVGAVLVDQQLGGTVDAEIGDHLALGLEGAGVGDVAAGIANSLCIIRALNRPT